MLSHITKYALGLKDKKRIAAITEQLLYDTTPTLTTGVLYMDGEGTASGYIARRAAQIFLSGDFNRVVITGSRIPAGDWKSKLVFPRLEKDALPLPTSVETEAQYMARIFANEVGDARMQDSFQKIQLIEGKNTGEKIRNSREAFADASHIQAVTLVYGQRRVHGTFRQELGEEPVVSVDGVYPLGITKENWDKWFLSYAVVMDEADKTGPRFDGKSPAYRKFFKDIDLSAETARIAPHI